MQDSLHVVQKTSWRPWFLRILRICLRWNGKNKGKELCESLYEPKWEKLPWVSNMRLSEGSGVWDFQRLTEVKKGWNFVYFEFSQKHSH